MKNKNNSTLQIGTTGGGNLSYGSNGIVDLKPFPGFEDPVVKKQMTNGIPLHEFFVVYGC